MEETRIKQGIEKIEAELMETVKKEEDLRKRLYEEKMALIKLRMEDGSCEPYEKLKESRRVRLDANANLHHLRLVNVQHKFEAEDLAIRQNYESEKQLLYDSIKSDLEYKIRQLEEDRNTDFTSERWIEIALEDKPKKSIDIVVEKQKKPILVCGRSWFYALREDDIVGDWKVIKKALLLRKYGKYGEMY